MILGTAARLDNVDLDESRVQARQRKPVVSDFAAVDVAAANDLQPPVHQVVDRQRPVIGQSGLNAQAGLDAVGIRNIGGTRKNDGRNCS